MVSWVSAARAGEVKVHGQHACRALYARRAADILRVYVTREAATPFGDLLRACAEMRRPYRLVSAEELERITDSRHHEGICVVARPRPTATLQEILRAPGAAWLLGLGGVSNPHNTGAIIRSAAHFGARAVLLGGGEPRLPPAAHRTAQGGAEWVDVLALPAPGPALDAVRAAGFTVCATSSHGGADLLRTALPARALVLLGAEAEGLPPALARAADLTLRIAGTGHVESLNVAAAAAVVLAELWRQHAGARRFRGS
jgi:TrmH RNA methyltransferase